MNTGLNNWLVRALVFSLDYTNDQTLFVGTYGSGVFKSTNGAASWSTMNAGLGDLHIESLALTPTSSRTLFVGTEGSSVWQYTELLLPYKVYLPLMLKGYTQ
jgi:hypothetical protein